MLELEDDMHILKGTMLIGLVAIAVLSFTACKIEVAEPVTSITPSPEPKLEKAIIRDRTGRSWDVTHARDVYGMSPDYFNYGLGTGAIPSVDNPRIIGEGDPGYPDPDSNISVFGVSHNGEQRAYSVRVLTNHEVFNDVYPGESGQYVAVTY